MKDTCKYNDHRIILLVDDDASLMHNYHNWMAKLSDVYHNIYNSSMHRLYDIRVFDIKDLASVLDKIKSNVFGPSLDLVITDFDLITGTGNDVAKLVRAKFPDTKIVGNTGGDTTRFDKNLVDSVVSKIADANTFYRIINANTTIVRDTGVRICLID